MTPTGPASVVELVLSSSISGETETLRVDSPLLLIGRSSQCDLRLIHPDVSRRHACLHFFRDRVLCIDLGSRTGTFWPDGQRTAGWLTAGLPVRVGPFELRLRTTLTPADDIGAEALFSRQPAGEMALGGAGLRFLNPKEVSADPIPLSRPITLVGRSAHCKLRLHDESVSRVHSSLMLTPEGVWIADLLGRGGVKVNGSLASLARLSPGDELQIGRYRMEFVTDLPAAAEEPEDHRPDAAAPPAPGPGTWPATGVSESLLLAVTETFADMQRQMSEQFRYQMELMVGLVESLRQEMSGEIRQELARLAAISEEIRDAQRQLAREAFAPPAPQSLASPSAESQSRRLEASRGAKRVATASEPPPSRDGVADHALLTRRLHELERERASRWLKLVDLMKGGR
ncbi:MAG TPA: FHA domain-containing protein [Planctomycetaceae bacterium]